MIYPNFENPVHTAHIPVMGSGHSIDSPIRVAPYGISSVISLVDDLLLEPIRKYYCKNFDLPFESIPRSVEDGRAKRITAYLNMVHDVVEIKFNHIKNFLFEEGSEKIKYFEMLPNGTPLKEKYFSYCQNTNHQEKLTLEKELTQGMRPGSIDVNIMVKLDKINYNKKGELLSQEFSDAQSALRGYAMSKLHSCIVFSAGINQKLFSYASQFKDFYRNSRGIIKKKIILKVSDYRSTIIQGKFLARKGLEIYEYRIESGLNCGGHAFASNGFLLPQLLEEFSSNRNNISQNTIPIVHSYYDKHDLDYVGEDMKPRLTVQGGLGHIGESNRMHQVYGMDGTGWASPFLLVPEATCIDQTTRNQLAKAKPEDLYLSDVSPLGVVFNNMKNTGSEKWTRNRVDKGIPGSPCPKKFLVSNLEYTEREICTASREYQKQKLEEIENTSLNQEQKQDLQEKAFVKTCICDHLGNGALINLGLIDENKAPQSICPGPNVAWFDREYSLLEMMMHIYGQGECLVNVEERPHMFAKEIQMYLDHCVTLIKNCDYTNLKQVNEINNYIVNLFKGLDLSEKITQDKVFSYENIKSLKEKIVETRKELTNIQIKHQEKQ